MTLAEQLREISVATADERKKLASKFRGQIEGHKEERILLKCVEHAEKGEFNVMLGKTLPPAELKQEGLKFMQFWAAVFCCWD